MELTAIELKELWFLSKFGGGTTLVYDDDTPLFERFRRLETHNYVCFTKSPHKMTDPALWIVEITEAGSARVNLEEL